MNWKQILTVMGVSAVTAVTSVMVYSKIAGNTKEPAGQMSNGRLPANYANYTPMGDGNVPSDFTAASQTAVPAVVHIKTKIKAKKVTAAVQRNPFFDDPVFEQFFGEENPFSQRQRVTPEQRATGSGVFITGDGYILTNNHVIDGADEVKVTLSNKKIYDAKVIGADPLSDLAVIKIEGSNFPYLVYGNSDDVKIGQWVLAVGYPLTLDCSVTAGIVSAKARSLGLNSERAVQQNKAGSAIESYIQTDAAVNKGNSGGALVNTQGQLIGINSAIASPTGFYAGYSYAIPVNIAKKIANDLMKHGSSQRAYLGIRPAIRQTEGEPSEVKDGKGVEVRDVAPGSAAAAAGLKSGDVINKINGRDISTWNELVEQVASYNVGDKIALTYLRDGKETSTTATLKNLAGNFEVVTQQTLAQQLGAELENVDAKKAKEYGIEGGVSVKNLDAKGLLKTQNPSIRKGLVIIRVNGGNIGNIEEMARAIEANKSNSTIIQGFYPGYEGVYTYVINKNVEEEE